MRRGILGAVALLAVQAIVLHSAPVTFVSEARGETAEEARLRVETLDRKFAELKAARSGAEAAPLVAEIWALWRQSGRREIDDLLKQGIALMRIGAQQPALAVLNEVITRAPDFAEGWNARATLLYEMDEYDRSLADCEEVLKREPRHFGALSGMGMIGIAQDNYKGALAAYRRALDINPHLLGREIVEALERKVEGQKL